MTGVDVTGGDGKYYITGQLNGWTFSEMTLVSNSIYTVTLNLVEGTSYIYYFTIHTNWAANMRETIPAECDGSADVANGWTGDRAITVPVGGTSITYPYGGCGTSTSIHSIETLVVACTPNPATDVITISAPAVGSSATVEIIDLVGNKVISQEVVFENDQAQLDVSDLTSGLYIVVVKSLNKVYTNKLNIR